MPVDGPAQDLPAAAWYTDAGSLPADPGGEQPQPLSAEVIAKRRARPAAARRMAELLDGTTHGQGLRLRPITDLFEGVDWVGVVHADANRLGRLFQESADLLPTLDADLGERSLAALSDQVRWCAEEAFGDAVTQVPDCAAGQRSCRWCRW